MTIRRMKSGTLEYRWRDQEGQEQTAGESDILHVVGRTLNGRIGVSPMTYARHVMGSALAADKAAAKMFAQGLLLSGTFETDIPVKEGQREIFQERLKAYQGAIASGRAPLLEAGVKYKPISINPNDAQMLQTREYTVAQIARWFRVPPHMIGHTTNSTSWGTGLEEQKIGFLTFTLQRWIKRIEDECTRKLFDPVDRMRFHAGFSFEGLLRADSAKRAAYFSQMTQNGIYTRDYCRGLEGLPPLGGNAGVLTVQSNLVPLDKLGEQAPAPTPIEPVREPDPQRQPEPPQKAGDLTINIAPPSITVHHRAGDVNVDVPERELHFEATMPDIKTGDTQVDVHFEEPDTETVVKERDANLLVVRSVKRKIKDGQE